MKIPAKRSSRVGLSLIEACLAILFLVIAYLPLSQLFHLTSQQTVASRNQLVAQQLACNLFELYPTQRSLITGGASGTGVFQSADLLAGEAVRTLLTGEAQEVLDTIRFSEMKMRVEIEPCVQKKPLDRIEVVLSWKEGGNPREAAHGRLIAR